jgi:hypothetical protein
MNVPKAIPAVVLAVLVGASLFMGYFNLDGWLMNDDEGAYLYDAWRVSLGEVPYRDFFLSQTPLSFYAVAGLFKVFGPSVWAARALSYLCVLGAAVLVALMSFRFLGFGPLVSAAAGFVFLFTKHVYFLGRNFMPDDAMLFLSAAALTFALKSVSGGPPQWVRRAAFGFGLCAGLATLAKLNAILLVVGYGLFLSIAAARKSLRAGDAAGRGAAMLAGFVLTFGLVYGVLLIAVPGTFQATIGFHAAKQRVAGDVFILALSRIRHFIGNHDYGLVLLAIIGLVAGGRLKGLRRTLLLCLLSAVLLQVFLPEEFYIRYVVAAFLPLALLGADGFRALFKTRAVRVVLLPVAAALLLLSLAPTFSPKKLLARDEGTRALAAFVERATGPGEYVFGDDPEINFLARRACPPRLTDVSGAMVLSGQVTAADIRAECEKYQVALILVETAGPAHHLINLRDYGAFEAYLRDAYEYVTAVDREFLRVEIYRRISSRTTSATSRLNSSGRSSMG